MLRLVFPNLVFTGDVTGSICILFYWLQQNLPCSICGRFHQKLQKNSSNLESSCIGYQLLSKCSERIRNFRF